MRGTKLGIHLPLIPLALLKRLGDRRGSSLVEVALVLSIVAPVMLLGTAEMASMVYASIEVSNAAHAGAAFAAQYFNNNSGAGLPSAAQVTTAVQNDAPELVHMLKPGTSLSITVATGCNGSPASNGSSLPNCSPGILPYVQVTTQATVAPLSGILPNSLSMTTSAVMNLVN